MIAIIIEKKTEHPHNTTYFKKIRNYTRFFESDDFDYEMSCGYNNCPDTPLKVSLSQPTIASTYVLYTSLCILVIVSIANTIILTDDLSYKLNNESADKLTLKLIGKVKKCKSRKIK